MFGAASDVLELTIGSEQTKIVVKRNDLEANCKQLFSIEIAESKLVKN